MVTLRINRNVRTSFWRTNRNADAFSPNGSTEAPTDVHQHITEGLLYNHSRLNANTAKILEATFLYGLIKLMSEKGLITVDELYERKRTVGQRLVEQFCQNGDCVTLRLSGDYDIE